MFRVNNRSCIFIMQHIPSCSSFRSLEFIMSAKLPWYHNWMRFCMGIETFVNSISHMGCVHEGVSGSVANEWDNVWGSCNFLWQVATQTLLCFVFPSFERAHSISKILFRKLFSLLMKMSWIFPHSNAQNLLEDKYQRAIFPNRQKKRYYFACTRFTLQENFLHFYFPHVNYFTYYKATDGKTKWNEFHRWDKCQKWVMIVHHSIRTQVLCLPVFSKWWQKCVINWGVSSIHRFSFGSWHCQRWLKIRVFANILL